MVAQTKPYPSMVDHLVEQVCDRILSGEYAPGTKFTEGQLAEDFGASRTPVREAIRALAELGLVVVRPRCGVEVATVSEKDMQQISALRVELELLALRSAMPKLGPREIEKLEELQLSTEHLLSDGTRIEVFRRDSAFHLALARMSGNPYVEEALERLDARVQLCRMMLCQSDAKVHASVMFHRKILAAIRNNDMAAAESLMREHIERTQI